MCLGVIFLAHPVFAKIKKENPGLVPVIIWHFDRDRDSGRSLGIANIRHLDFLQLCMTNSDWIVIFLTRIDH